MALAGGELLVADKIVLGVGELRLVLRLLGDGLVELGLVGGRIDAREHVALLDVLAFLEIDRDQLAVDLRAHGHGVERFDGADRLQIDRHVGGLGGGDQHRHRSFGGETAAPLLLRG